MFTRLVLDGVAFDVIVGREIAGIHTLIFFLLHLRSFRQKKSANTYVASFFVQYVFSLLR